MHACMQRSEPPEDDGDLLWDELQRQAPPLRLDPRTGIREAKVVDDLLTRGGVSWQRAHRSRHQPQIESLLSHAAQLQHASNGLQTKRQPLSRHRHL